MDNTLFWKDWWLHGKSLAYVASHVVSLVSRRTVDQHIVGQVLLHNQWVRDIRGGLAVAALVEYLQL